MDKDKKFDIGQLVNGITQIGGVVSGIIGSTKGRSGSVTTGGSTIVYGNTNDSTAMPKWLLPVGVAVFGLFGLFMVVKH